jgi:hypothetical protein
MATLFRVEQFGCVFDKDKDVILVYITQSNNVLAKHRTGKATNSSPTEDELEASGQVSTKEKIAFDVEVLARPKQQEHIPRSQRRGILANIAIVPDLQMHSNTATTRNGYSPRSSPWPTRYCLPALLSSTVST